MRVIGRWKWRGVAACWLLAATPFAAAQQTGARARSTAKERTSLGITLYNSNFALIRETRRVDLPAGTVRLNFEDVPATIEPSTVYLGPVRGVDVLDQSYEYDLLNPQRLMEKYVGKQVTLVLHAERNGSSYDKDLKATLLSTNGPVWKIGNEIVTGIHPAGIHFPELPGELHSRPTLVWHLKDASAGERTLAVSYLASRMTWHADYVLNLARDEKEASLEGWVTLENNSGTSFDDARLSLVAGQVHRVTAPGPRPMPMMARAQSVLAGGVASQFQEQAAGEYHLYTLKRPVSLRNQEAKQIRLLSAASVPVKTTYVLEGNPNVYRVLLPQPARPGVKVFLSFRNDTAAGLGEPLPAGVVRVYEPDRQGNPILLGEDTTRHTPKDETVRLDVGNAFDIVAKRRQTDFRKISNRVYESAFEITLRNHKSVPVTVEVRARVNGSWEVLRSSVPAKKLNAFTLGFDVPVPANGETKLMYRVRVTD